MSEGVKPRSVMLVELNLEETGVLCHLLMQAMLDAEKAMQESGSKRSFLKAMPEFDMRMNVLYGKLAGANDALMGKT